MNNHRGECCEFDVISLETIRHQGRIWSLKNYVSFRLSFRLALTNSTELVTTDVKNVITISDKSMPKVPVLTQVLPNME